MLWFDQDDAKENKTINHGQFLFQFSQTIRSALVQLILSIEQIVQANFGFQISSIGKIIEPHSINKVSFIYSLVSDNFAVIKKEKFRKKIELEKTFIAQKNWRTNQ